MRDSTMRIMLLPNGKVEEVGKWCGSVLITGFGVICLHDVTLNHIVNSTLLMLVAKSVQNGSIS